MGLTVHKTYFPKLISLCAYSGEKFSYFRLFLVTAAPLPTMPLIRSNFQVSTRCVLPSQNCYDKGALPSNYCYGQIAFLPQNIKADAYFLQKLLCQGIVCLLCIIVSTRMKIFSRGSEKLYP